MVNETMALNAAAWELVPPSNAYCVECKKKRKMVDRSLSETPNQCRGVQGACPECGAPMFLVVSSEDARKTASAFVQAVGTVRRHRASVSA